MTPARGTVLVRKLETEDTYRGGKIVLPEKTRESLTANQVEIVAVGYNAPCENDECERPHIDIEGTPFHWEEIGAGQWAVLAPRSLVATHEPGLFIARQDAVLAIVKP